MTAVCAICEQPTNDHSWLCKRRTSLFAKFCSKVSFTRRIRDRWST